MQKHTVDEGRHAQNLKKQKKKKDQQVNESLPCLCIQMLIEKISDKIERFHSTI